MKIKYLSIALVILFISSGIAAWSKLSRIKEPIKKAVEPNLAEPVLDTALLNEFTHLAAQFDLTKKDLLLVGQLSIKDGADSTAQITDAPYIFSKQGDSFYCRQGNTETINANGVYLYVDHGLHKIMISSQKPIEPLSPIPSSKQLLENLKGEGYILKSEIIGNSKKLAFENPYHLSCKEYALFIDSGTKQLNKMQTRLSNILDHENSKMDKVIELRFSKVSNEPNLRQYTSQHFVERDNNTWKLGAAYQNYELIIL